MEAKPYSMQSPERVAEAYGGNKQKIAQAVQMGVIDPTSGLMAGMFIDRMRSAQAQEQAPNQTVAQRVLGPQAPPAPPAGLGATPQGMQMAGGPGPQMAAPPQMIPPAPQGPVRMAVGGLTTLPVPDDMYDEQSFAGGGIVAFAGGGEAEAARRKKLKALGLPENFQGPLRPAYEWVKENFGLNPETRAVRDYGTPSEMRATSKDMATALEDYRANATNIFGNNMGEASGAQFTPMSGEAAGLNALIESKNPNVRPASSAAPAPAPAPRADRGVVGAPRAPAATTETAAPDAAKRLTLEQIRAMMDDASKLPEYKGTSAEDRAAQKNEDLWSALAQIGFGAAAGDSPYALTNIGKGAAAAMPGMQASLKERRADERDERNREFDYLTKKAGIKGDNFKSAYTIFSSMEDREQRAYLEKLRIEAQASEGKLNRQAQLAAARIPTGGEKLNALNVAAFKQHYLDAGKTPAEAEYLARKDVLAAGASQFAGATALSGILNTQRENAVKTRGDIIRNEGKRYPDKASQKAALDAIEARIASIDADAERLGNTYGGSPSGAVTVPWRNK